MLKVIEGHTGQVNCVAIPTDGGKMVSGSVDYTVRVWSTETGEVHARPAVIVCLLACSPTYLLLAARAIDVATRVSEQLAVLAWS